MKRLLLVLPVLALVAGPGHARDNRTLFQQTRAIEQADASQAYAAMLALAEQGFAPAMDRVGYYHRNGIGTRKDLHRAHHWYARAVAGGHPWSRASLARVEIDMGLGLSAFHRLRNAVRQGKPGTERLFATAHIDRKLGRASKPEAGRAMLEDLSRQGDAKAARDLILRINWKRLKGPASDHAVALVVQTGLSGDLRFAEPALVYLSSQGGVAKDVVSMRAKLVSLPGVRGRIRSPERIRLAAIQTPRDFWRQVEKVLAESEGEGFVRAASTAFWINKNAWVRVLQKELRRMGYYDGEINGLMTNQTIRAQNRFCKDKGIWADCAAGPLTGKTLRAVATEIDAERGKT